MPERAVAAGGPAGLQVDARGLCLSCGRLVSRSIICSKPLRRVPMDAMDALMDATTVAGSSTRDDEPILIIDLATELQVAVLQQLPSFIELTYVPHVQGMACPTHCCCPANS